MSISNKLGKKAIISCHKGKPWASAGPRLEHLPATLPPAFQGQTWEPLTHAGSPQRGQFLWDKGTQAHQPQGPGPAIHWGQEAITQDVPNPFALHPSQPASQPSPGLFPLLAPIQLHQGVCGPKMSTLVSVTRPPLPTLFPHPEAILPSPDQYPYLLPGCATHVSPYAPNSLPQTSSTVDRLAADPA